MPIDNHGMEVWKTGRALQERYDYYLMALAVAAIGFAVQKTSGLHWTSSMVTLVPALLCWGISLFAGFRRQEHLGVILRCIYIMVAPPADCNEVRLAEAESKKEEDKAKWWRKIQFYAFLLGAILFIVWHVWNMFG